MHIYTSKCVCSCVLCRITWVNCIYNRIDQCWRAFIEFKINMHLLTPPEADNKFVCCSVFPVVCRSEQTLQLLSFHRKLLSAALMVNCNRINNSTLSSCEERNEDVRFSVDNQTAIRWLSPQKWGSTTPTDHTLSFDSFTHLKLSLNTAEEISAQNGFSEIFAETCVRDSGCGFLK